MNSPEFAQIRHSLGKTQQQLATALGVSLKAVQSFEQGWRQVPVPVERQLLFFLYLKGRLSGGHEPCWEQKSCPPEVREKCTAWEAQAGDLCWFVNGTLCEGRVQDSWHVKMDMCRQCKVFQSSVVAPSGPEDARPKDN